MSPCTPTRGAVAPDQFIGGTVVLELRFVRVLQLWNDFLRELLAEFHAPLVERVDMPDRALGEYAVLVQRDQRAQGTRRQVFGEDGVRGPVTLADTMRHQPFRRAFLAHLCRRLAEGQRFRLRD